MHRNRYKFYCLNKEFTSLRAPSPLAGEGRGEGEGGVYAN